MAKKINLKTQMLIDLIMLEQRRLNETERKLFDDLDYDRISRSEYDRRLLEAKKECAENIKNLKIKYK